jgi:NitT/TauT family transport system substrate-binding protein
MSVGVTRRGHGGIAAVAGMLAVMLAGPVDAQTALKLTLDGKIEGPSAPFFVALEQGYFKAEGLDVTIEPSVGALEPITRVASGAFDVGFGDVNALIRYRDQNPAPALKVVFVVNNRPGYAIIGRKSRGIDVPADLDGKKLGAPAAESASAQWPIFARVNNIDAAKVTVLNVGVPVREPMLAAGEVDAVTGTSSGTPIVLREKGVPAADISTILMASYGVELYGASVFVGAKFLAENPDAVKGFLRALVRGLKDTLKDPGAAAMTVVRRNGGTSRELELERLQVAIRDNVVTPEVQANGLGAFDPARVDTAIAQIGLAYSFKTRPSIGDIFDPAFLPPDDERRLD